MILAKSESYQGFIHNVYVEVDGLSFEFLKPVKWLPAMPIF